MKKERLCPAYLDASRRDSSDSTGWEGAQTDPLFVALVAKLEEGAGLRRGAISITAAIAAKRMTASEAAGNSGVVWVEVEVEAASTTTEPIIHEW
jgi:hypothetical protein